MAPVPVAQAPAPVVAAAPAAPPRVIEKITLNTDVLFAFNRAQLTPEEYPGYEDIKFTDPCLKVAFADGVRDVVLRFDSAELQETDVPELQIHLRDTVYPFRLTLRYRVHIAYDLIERSVTVANDGDTPVMIERI